MATKHFEGMKRIRNILASWSLVIAIMGLAVFAVCLFAHTYNKVTLWAGVVSFGAWAVFGFVSLFVSSNEENKAYLDSLSRGRAV